MHLHINHVFCLDSIWGGTYDSRYLVSIKRVIAGNTYFDTPNPDWVSLISQKPHFDKEEYKRFREHPDLQHIKEETHRSMCQKRTVFLKPHIMDWLNENIKDRPDKDSSQGWAVGTDQYNCTNPLSFSLWFHRKSDALAFIKKWSIHKKPVTYFDYFKEIRKELNEKTNKLEVVEKFTR